MLMFNAFSFPLISHDMFLLLLQICRSTVTLVAGLLARDWSPAFPGPGAPKLSGRDVMLGRKPKGDAAVGARALGSRSGATAASGKKRKWQEELSASSGAWILGGLAQGIEQYVRGNWVTLFCSFLVSNL